MLNSDLNLHDMLSTYQYANDALGKFVSAVKEDGSLSHKTIIGASGDHPHRGFNFAPSELFYKYNVPFYLFVPSSILSNVKYKYDPKKFGSHRDIPRTLLEFSLSDTKYLYLGNNLLSPASNVDFIGAHNNELLADDQGVYVLRDSEKFFQWNKAKPMMVSETAADSSPELKKKFEKLQAFEAFEKWLTFWQHQNDGKVIPNKSDH